MTMNRERPSLFIGSSAEGLPIAKAVQANLDYACETTIWSQGVFGLGEGTLEALVGRLDYFDFAALILTPDDLVESRKKAQPSPRDNVLLELGLFLGRLGRKRTFVVYDRTAALKMPSDLAGVTPATFQPHSSKNWQAALGAACTLIEKSIGELSIRRQFLSSIPAQPQEKPKNLLSAQGQDVLDDLNYQFITLGTEKVSLAQILLAIGDNLNGGLVATSGGYSDAICSLTSILDPGSNSELFTALSSDDYYKELRKFNLSTDKVLSPLIAFGVVERISSTEFGVHTEFYLSSLGNEVLAHLLRRQRQHK